MYTSFSFTSSCTCANRNLLAPGLDCEICMGIGVSNSDEQHSETSFGVDYFEALEDQISNEDMAA